MKLRNCNISRLLILILVAALLLPMIPEANAEGTYQSIDFSQAVLASRINQRVSGDCAVASMATIESYMHGVTSAADKEIVYKEVTETNGALAYAYWDNVGYLVYDEVDWEVIYQRLTMGVPSIIHRTKGNNPVQHWAVVAGYNGSATTLEWDKFIVVDVYMGSGLKDIKSTATWGSGCEINWMALRGSGMNIQLYKKTLIHWGDEFFGSISRKDTPGQVLSVAEDKENTSVFTAAANQSPQQRWKFTYHPSDGGYTIQSVHSGKVLTVSESASTDGTPLCMEAEATNNACQRWFIYETEAGYMLESKGTYKALSMFLADSNQNAAIHTYGQTAPQNLDIHVHQYETSEIPATCTQGAYTKYQCACADFYHVPGTEGPLGHQWETQEVIDADCLHTELTKTYCPVCLETAETYAEKTYCEWTEEAPKDMADTAVETQTLYRFRDRFGSWGEPEVVELDYVPQWPASFDTTSQLYTQYNQTPATKYETETERLDVVIDEESGYLYYHWCSGNGFGNTKTDEYTTFHAFYSTNPGSETDSTGAYYCPKNTDCPYSIWYYKVPVYHQVYLIQKQMEGVENWTPWSEWSNTEVAASEARQVETKTLYRYVTNFGKHIFSGSMDTDCDICGLVREVEKIETTPMYRLYNPNSGEHFYTGSTEERDMLASLGWQYEGVAWNAPTKKGTPVYRLFNPNNGDHHYTMSAEERDMLTALGWQYEGVAWNSASSSNIPMYRLFNPNADCGSHHYTGSMEEREFLVSLGWIYEGIGWYGTLK